MDFFDVGTLKMEIPQAELQLNMAMAGTTTAQDQLNCEVKHSAVVNMFPDLDLMETFTQYGHMSSDALVGYIIDNMGRIPKKRKTTKRKSDSPERKEESGEEMLSDLSDFEESDDDLILNRLIMELLQKLKRDLSKPPPPYYLTQRDNMESFLKDEFPTVRAEFIKTMVRQSEGRFLAASISCFLAEHRYGGKVQKYILTTNNHFWSQVDPMNKRRPLKKIKRDYTEHDFMKEFQRFEKLIDTCNSKFPGLLRGRKLTKEAYTLKVDAQETTAEQKLECIVCFETYPVSRMVFCTISGELPLRDPGQPSTSKDATIDDFATHCFCRICVRGQAKAAMNEMPLADGGVGLKCMAHGCKNAILYAEIRNLIPSEVRKKLDERIMEENLGLAALQNLERCKNCNFAMEMEVPATVDKVFKCLQCDSEFCRLCERPWDEDHFGITCDELDVKQKTDKKQRELEKKMNEAVIRKCPRCSLPFIKAEGCNKMTCRCGMTQCYLCRETEINYSHFCEHFRDPRENSGKCERCKKPCLLWEDATRRDERILREIENEVNVGNADMQPKNVEAAEIGDNRPRTPPPFYEDIDDDSDAAPEFDFPVLPVRRRRGRRRLRHNMFDEFFIGAQVGNQIPERQLEIAPVIQPQPPVVPPPLPRVNNDPFNPFLVQPWHQVGGPMFPDNFRPAYAQPIAFGGMNAWDPAMLYNNNYHYNFFGGHNPQVPAPPKEYESCQSCGRRYLKNSPRCTYCNMDNNQNLAQPQEINDDQGNMPQIQQPGTPFRSQPIDPRKPAQRNLSPFRADDPNRPGPSNANHRVDHYFGMMDFGLNEDNAERPDQEMPRLNRMEVILEPAINPLHLATGVAIPEAKKNPDRNAKANQRDKYEQMCSHLKDEIEQSGIQDQIRRKKTPKKLSPQHSDLDLLLQDLKEIEQNRDQGSPMPGRNLNGSVKNERLAKNHLPEEEAQAIYVEWFGDPDKPGPSNTAMNRVYAPNPDVPGPSNSMATGFHVGTPSEDLLSDKEKLEQREQMGIRERIRTLQEIQRRQNSITSTNLEQERALDRLIFTSNDADEAFLDSLRGLRNRISQTNDESFKIANELRHLVSDAIINQPKEPTIGDPDEPEVVGIFQRRIAKTPVLIMLSSDDESDVNERARKNNANEEKNLNEIFDLGLKAISSDDETIPHVENDEDDDSDLNHWDSDFTENDQNSRSKDSPIMSQEPLDQLQPSTSTQNSIPPLRLNKLEQTNLSSVHACPKFSEPLDQFQPSTSAQNYIPPLRLNKLTLDKQADDASGSNSTGRNQEEESKAEFWYG
uniref:RING-type domain-containing protein n=1 Tax=Acrobeloides nanus TaxID=290746 RepID=A0A914C685_9BILA